MSDRSSYEKISIEEFLKEMTGNLFSFSTNMKHLGIEGMSFPEWYETLAAWSEVGTSMEEVTYHRYECCKSKDCKICFK